MYSLATFLPSDWLIATFFMPQERKDVKSEIKYIGKIHRANTH